MRDKIIELLRSTERPGMDKLIEWMDENGFFIAPCSSQYHLAITGGLAEHSMNVYEVAHDVFVGFHPYGDMLPWEWANFYKNELDELRIVCLLHDLGKCGQFGKPLYIENWIKEGRPTKSNPEPQMVRSEKKPYLTNAELFNVPHEIRSISIIDRYIDLTEEEQFAILYHNGLYGPLKYEIAGKETPLYLLLHFADMWCSRVIEKEEKESEE